MLLPERLLTQQGAHAADQVLTGPPGLALRERKKSKVSHIIEEALATYISSARGNMRLFCLVAGTCFLLWWQRTRFTQVLACLGSLWTAHQQKKPQQHKTKVPRCPKNCINLESCHKLPRPCDIFGMFCFCEFRCAPTPPVIEIPMITLQRVPQLENPILYCQNP